MEITVNKMVKRGFEMLVGKTIKSVNQEETNIVYLVTTDGSKFEINAENHIYDIEILHLTLVTE
jgi:hypothetical protein